VGMGDSGGSKTIFFSLVCSHMFGAGVSLQAEPRVPPPLHANSFCTVAFTYCVQHSSEPTPP
jgi:hypothetical protein